MQLLNANCETRNGASVTVVPPFERNELAMAVQSFWFGPVKGVPEQVVVQAEFDMDMGAAAARTALSDMAEELVGRGERNVVTMMSEEPGTEIRDVEPVMNE